MYYYSLNDRNNSTDFRSATIAGQAPDRGLYFPSQIPVLSPAFIEALPALSKEEVALEVIRPYVADAIPLRELRTIVEETISFDFPLVPVTGRMAALELYHGPTLAFKDVGARFMSRCLRYFVQQQQKQVTVLVATSGDTGSAVANGFYEVEGIEVVILYPSGKVSTIQEAQLTRLGKNITALEVAGSFDDCQRMVKTAFADCDLNQHHMLTSANSINIARWLPQQFYYFFALQQWENRKQPPVISVPSGNFGNLCAGMLANASGLPVQHFIAACNANDTIPRLLERNSYQPGTTIPTLSNAMDVSDPSNFVRIAELFGKNLSAIKNKLSAFSISDKTTRETIQQVLLEQDYLLDPHGAIGFTALKQYLEQHPDTRGLFLETAHPVKFYDVLEPITHQAIPVPSQVKSLLQKEQQSLKIPATYEALKDVLTSRAYIK